MKAKKILLAVMLLLIIGFIWSNSMDNSDKSYIKSGRAMEIIINILSPVFPEDGKVMRYISNESHIRKIGHFVEYFLLGQVTAGISYSFSEKSIKYFYIVFSVPFVISVIDEFIQYFTGRTYLIKDVWIDCAGYLSGAFLIYMIILIIKYLIKSKNKSAQPK